VFDLTPSPWGALLYLVGWSAGWWLLARPRTLPAAHGAARPPVAVIIPARDEAAVIGALVTALVARRRAGDEIVVVTGSIYLLGEIMARIHPAEGPGEGRLQDF
jgi:hypothetical protein